ncbi:putative membrane protein, partial [Emiliania huxleyi virus 99B1]
MEFHWPTAGITTAVMVVLLCVVYFIAVYLRGGQAYFPILTEAIVCVGLLCGAYNTGGMTEEQA